MREEHRIWMEYVDHEVRAVCDAKGWGSQIRRKWSAREKPVSESPIDDYEWKLIPGTQGRLADADPNDFDGVYYVFSFDEPNGRFVLQHDTHHVGVWGPHWEQSSYTEIGPSDMTTYYVMMARRGPAPDHPAVGWLRDHLLDLVSRCGPNRFSRT